MTRFGIVISGGTADRVPVVPKIWIDLAARIMGVSFLDALNDPQLAMKTVVRACLKLEMDAARLLLFPPRRIELVDGAYVHLDPGGRRLGRVDIEGGWATHFDDPAAVDIARDEVMFDYAHFLASRPALADESDLRRMAIPAAAFYEKAGYGREVDEIAAEAGNAIALIGDCSSGTLAFHVAMRGMDQALLDLYDHPRLVHASMEKGIALCIERAKFFLAHGIKTLRYNDSVANMSVISPDQWREFIFPGIKRFCDTVHGCDAQARIYCHICGNILPIARDLAATGLDCISPLDPLGGMTVAEVRQAVGDDVILMGGVNTLALLNARPQEVEADARRCIQEGNRNGRFILGSGCVVPRATPMASLRAMRAAAATQ